MEFDYKKVNKPSRIALIVVACLAVLIFIFARGQREVVLPPHIMRISKTTFGDLTSLDVPIAHYRGGGTFNGVNVDFIGAVHLGDKQYYQQLNERFAKYDSVLFELVADAGKIEGLGTKESDSALGLVQRKFAEILGLSFQLDEIDYTKPNFVHADMTPSQLMVSMASRGESLPQLLWKLITLSFDPEVQKSVERAGLKPNTLDNINPLMILIRGPTKEEQLTIRRFMATGLTASDEILKLLDQGNGSSIITDRNKVAVDVVKSELAKGKHSLAIFYGAGHLPNMHERLVRDAGLRLVEVEWMKAWTLDK